MALTLLTKFRHQLEPVKDQAYLKYFRDTYCIVDGVQIYDPHHIMGSTFGMKFTDYLLVKASREMHNKWQRDLPKYFDLLLQPAVENLIIYAKENGVIKLQSDLKYYRNNWDNPLALNILFDLLKKERGDRYVFGKSYSG